LTRSGPSPASTQGHDPLRFSRDLGASEAVVDRQRASATGRGSGMAGRYNRPMSEAALDLELVVSAERELTVPAAELERLAAVPGQRVRVRIEATPTPRRSLLGVFAEADRTRLTLDDFDALSDDMWSATGYGSV